MQATRARGEATQGFFTPEPTPVLAAGRSEYLKDFCSFSLQKNKKNMSPSRLKHKGVRLGACAEEARSRSEVGEWLGGLGANDCLNLFCGQYTGRVQRSGTVPVYWLQKMEKGVSPQKDSEGSAKLLVKIYEAVAE